MQIALNVKPCFLGNKNIVILFKPARSQVKIKNAGSQHIDQFIYLYIPFKILSCKYNGPQI